MPLFRPQLLKEGKKPQTEILSSKGSGGNNKDNSNEKKNHIFLTFFLVQLHFSCRPSQDPHW